MLKPSSAAVAAAVLAVAVDGNVVPPPRLEGWKPRSMKTAKKRAHHKRRRKLAAASRRKNRA